MGWDGIVLRTGWVVEQGQVKFRNEPLSVQKIYTPTTKLEEYQASYSPSYMQARHASKIYKQDIQASLICKQDMYASKPCIYIYTNMPYNIPTCCCCCNALAAREEEAPLLDLPGVWEVLCCLSFSGLLKLLVFEILEVCELLDT